MSNKASAMPTAMTVLRENGRATRLRFEDGGRFKGFGFRPDKGNRAHDDITNKEDVADASRRPFASE